MSTSRLGRGEIYQKTLTANHSFLLCAAAFPLLFLVSQSFSPSLSYFFLGESKTSEHRRNLNDVIIIVIVIAVVVIVIVVACLTLEHKLELLRFRMPTRHAAEYLFGARSELRRFRTNEYDCVLLCSIDEPG